MASGAALAALGGSTASAQSANASSEKATVAFGLGLASYTLRQFDLDQVIAMTKRVGLTRITLKSMHMPLDASDAQIKSMAQKVRRAGLDLYGAGVIYMKNEAQVQEAFHYAQVAGLKVIVGVPDHPLLPLVEKKVKETDICVAIHNHGPGDNVYPAPASVYDRVKTLDKRIGLCMDIGHTQRLGIDPCDAARQCADRLLDVHIKDVSSATAQGATLEIGRGVIDIPGFLTTLKQIGYARTVGFEYEKDADDPMPGLSESVGYVRGVLDTMS
ncbi:MAG: sugar phosphate isomerase/epimerase [Phycisphaerae bacterium]|nr:sugar phosphate isomerase/epimerase [Phycisphaerae bacterium]